MDWDLKLRNRTNTVIKKAKYLIWVPNNIAAKLTNIHPPRKKICKLLSYVVCRSSKA